MNGAARAGFRDGADGGKRGVESGGESLSGRVVTVPGVRHRIKIGRQNTAKRVCAVDAAAPQHKVRGKSGRACVQGLIALHPTALGLNVGEGVVERAREVVAGVVSLAIVVNRCVGAGVRVEPKGHRSGCVTLLFKGLLLQLSGRVELLLRSRR